MSIAEPPDTARRALVAAARERLREHLEREAAVLAGNDVDGVLPELEQLSGQLRAGRPV